MVAPNPLIVKVAVDPAKGQKAFIMPDYIYGSADFKPVVARAEGQKTIDEKQFKIVETYTTDLIHDPK